MRCLQGPRAARQLCACAQEQHHAPSGRIEQRRLDPAPNGVDDVEVDRVRDPAAVSVFNLLDGLPVVDRAHAIDGSDLELYVGLDERLGQFRRDGDVFEQRQLRQLGVHGMLCLYIKRLQPEFRDNIYWQQK